MEAEAVPGLGLRRVPLPPPEGPLRARRKGAELAIIAAKKKKKRSASGITKAKKRYTDQRKLKMASLRSLKAKRIREFATKTRSSEEAAHPGPQGV